MDWWAVPHHTQIRVPLRIYPAMKVLDLCISAPLEAWEGKAPALLWPPTSQDLLGSFFFFITVLMRYNSHTIQFTWLKCTIQQLLVYSRSCAFTTTINFRTCSLLQK